MIVPQNLIFLLTLLYSTNYTIHTSLPIFQIVDNAFVTLQKHYDYSYNKKPYISLMYISSAQ